MFVQFAKECAWRAIYVNWGTRAQPGMQICHIGLDPSRSPRPQIFGAINWRRRAFRLRVNLPRAVFGENIPWYKLDGRNAYYASQRAATK